jgi:serine/threonine protein kinase HipA of HipAB toxin-antitoxin module
MAHLWPTHGPCLVREIFHGADFDYLGGILLDVVAKALFVFGFEEDFCQVEGVSPLQKYENDGGPGLQALFKTLRQSENAEQDMRTVMTAQLLFCLLGAPDGHAKNFSVHKWPGGRFQLTKLYDVLSAYPVRGAGPSLWSPVEVKMTRALPGFNQQVTDTILGGMRLRNWQPCLPPNFE